MSRQAERVPATEVDVEHTLKQFIGDQCDTELGRRAAHSGNGTLPESLETFLGIDLSGSIGETVVRCLAFASNDLWK